MNAMIPHDDLDWIKDMGVSVLGDEVLGCALVLPCFASN